MRIGLVVASLEGGGAERVVCLLAGEWAAAGHRVTVITLLPESADAYPLPAGVERLSLGYERRDQEIWKRAALNAQMVRALEQTFERVAADVLVSFVDQINVLTLLASRGRWPVIPSERSAPEHCTPTRPIRVLRRVAYPMADALVVQTDAARAFFRARFPHARIVVIPNPVLPPADTAPPAEKLVLSVGRFTREKGHDLLIRAFARGAPADWKLRLAGDGPLRGELEALARELGVEARVEFAGWTREAFASGASLFVLPSRHEGFPNALLEAMARGIAVISFDCPHGPAAIVRPGVDGVLVPAESVEALAGAIARLAAAPEERARLGDAALSVLDRFSMARVMRQWDSVIREASGARPSTPALALNVARSLLSPS
jgi:GalNAc-alpha-(1->4)-GalNAc-alpha-(1->3)-diNAcBac-PP-undecaprenol alpha-1,4-N-acetyl-D-galactosaminyltransferase